LHPSCFGREEKRCRGRWRWRRGVEERVGRGLEEKLILLVGGREETEELLSRSKLLELLVVLEEDPSR